MKPDSNGQQVSTPQKIAEWIARYRASGLGLPRFAQEHGIASGRLHYWLYQKRRGRPTGRHGQPRRLSGLSLAPVFREVKLAACLSPGRTVQGLLCIEPVFAELPDRPTPGG